MVALNTDATGTFAKEGGENPKIFAYKFTFKPHWNSSDSTSIVC